MEFLNNKSGKNDKVTDVCQNLMQTLSVYDNGSENVSIYNDHYQKPTPKMNRFVLRGFFPMRLLLLPPTLRVTR